MMADYKLHRAVLAAAALMGMGSGATLAAAPLDNEVLEGLRTGRDVSALVGRALAETRSAARPATQPGVDVGGEFRAALADLRSGLAAWRQGAAGKSAAVAGYQRFLGADLLLRAHFDEVRGRLQEAGAGGFESRRSAAQARHAALVASLTKRLDPHLAGKAGLLPGTAPKAAAEAIEIIRAQTVAAAPRLLRADGLPYRGVNLPPRAPVAVPAIAPSFLAAVDQAAQEADLAASPDAPLSDEIVEKARALDNDYVKIFEFVRNGIRTQWYAGGMKGAVGTLRSGAGNDVDQASLLIALLRSAGMPARYVHGVVELPADTVAVSLGLTDPQQAAGALAKAGIAAAPVVQAGRVAALRVEHTWVSAFAPYTNYRGVYLDGSGKTWLPLDASVKQLDRRPATRILDRMGLVSAQAARDFLESGTSQTGQDYLTSLRLRVVDYLNQNGGGSYESQLSAASVTPLKAGLLPNSLPYQLVAVTGESASLAADRQVQVRIVLRTGTKATDPVSLDVTTPLQEFANDRVTLSYMPATLEDHRTVLGFGGMNRTPAYLIQLRPQIRVGGENRYAGREPVAVGVPVKVEISFVSPAGRQRFEQTIVTGAYHALGFWGNSLTRPAKAAPSDGEFEAARLLDAIARQYLQRWEDGDREISGLLDVPVVYPMPAVVMVSNEMRTEFVGDNPYSLRWQGVSMDAALRVAQPLGAGAADWMRLSALEGSSLEHALFESQFGVDAISADKGLQLARQDGQEVLVLSGADAGALDGSDHPDAVKNDIRNWLRLGYRVEVPAAQLGRNNWLGSVWRVEDQATGAAGYYIAGSLAGGASTPDLWTLDYLAAALAATDGDGGDKDPMAAARMVRIGGTDAQEGKAGEDVSSKLAVFVTNRHHVPVIGAAVTFRAAAGGGKVDGAATATVLTNQFGVAEVTATLGEKTSDSPVFVMRNPGDEHATQAGFNSFDADVASARGNIPLDEPFRIVAMPGDLASLKTESLIYHTKVVTNAAGGSNQDSIEAIPRDRFDNVISNETVTYRAGSTQSSCPGGGSTTAAVYEFGTCPTTFFAGECGSSSVSVKSSILGAHAGLVLGAEVNATVTFTVQAGSFTQEHKYTTFGVGDGNCESYYGSGYNLLMSAGGRGKNTRSGKPWTPHKEHDQIAFMVQKPTGYKVENCRLKFEPTFTLERAQLKLNSLSATNGASAAVVQNSMDGLHVQLTTPPAPSLGQPVINGDVEYDHVYISDCNVKSGSTSTTWYGNLPGAWAVRPVIDSVTSLGTPANVNPRNIVLDGQGRSLYPLAIDYHIEPGEYEGLLADVELLKDSAWMGYVVAPKVKGSGQVMLPRGDSYSVDATYEAKPVVNRGDPNNEVKGEAFTIPIRQKIINWYSRSLGVSQSVDAANGRLCARGSALGFELAREAQITIVATSTTGITRQLIGGTTYPVGLSEYPIGPGDLPAGDYSFQLTAVATNDGESETETGYIDSRLTVFNSLPVGQTLVKGVNVRTGALSLPAQSVQVPGRGPALHFQPMFSSGESTTLGPLGVNWTHNYDAGIHVDSCGTVHVSSGDGGSAKFFPRQDGSLVPDKGYHATLIADRPNNAFDYYSKDGTRYHFTFFNQQDQWKLASITDANGNITKLEYDPAFGMGAKLLRVVDPAGRAFGFTYEQRFFNLPIDPRKQWNRDVIVRMTGPGGISVAFDYDSFGNLIRVDRDGRTQAFEYSTGEFEPGRQHNITSYTDPLGGVTNYAYTRSEFSFGVVGGMGVLSAPVTYVSQATSPDGGVTTYAPDTATWSASHVNDVGMGIDYTFNIYGSVLTAADGAGTTSYSWAENDVLLLSRTDPGGVTTTYGYDASGNVTHESTGGLSISRTWMNQASPPYIKNKPLSYTDRNGNTTSYSVDGAGNLLAEHRPLGAVTSHSYGSNGDRLSTTDANGHTTSYSYDSFGNRASEADAIGATATYSHDVRSRMTGRIDKRGGAYAFAYDALDNMVSSTDPLGGRKTYSYDLAGNRLSETDEEGRHTGYTYDAMSRLTGITKPLGAAKALQYDKAGSKTGESDWNGNGTGFAYDGARRLASRTEPGGFVTSYSHDGSGNVTAETDPAGHKVSHGYDSANRRIRTTDAEGGTWTFDLDGNGNRLGETDPLGRVTSFQYDALDRLVRKTAPLGRVTTFSYDAKGNKLAETDPNGSTTRFTYDAVDRLIQKTDALGFQTEYQYDKAGNLVAEIDARVHANHYDYDPNNRRIAAKDALGHITRYGYDGVGNRTDEWLANGNHVGHSYDALNRRTASSDDLGSLGAWTYDPQGNKLTETDANGNTASHTYDERNLLIRSALPEGRSTARSYNPDATVATETAANGGVTQYRYDGLKRLTGTTDALGGTAAVGYDAVGNKLSETDRRGNTTRYAYDAANRLVRITDPLAQTQTYTYDANGNRLTETDKRGTLTEHAYDRLNRPTRTTKAGTVLAEIQYDEVGNKLFETDANGNKTGWEYDARNLLVQENRNLAAITRYTLDAMGDRISERDPENRVTGNAYDARRRLLRRTDAANQATFFEYDPAGNLIREVNPRGYATGHAYDGAHRLTRITDALGGATGYAYDKSGNVVAYTDANGRSTGYAYDLLNRRTGLTHPDGKTEAQAFDANGNRISLTDEAGRTTTYGYDPLNREIRRSFPAAPGGLVGIDTAHDANGNPVTVTETDGAGSRQTRYAYDAFDRITTHTDPWGKTAAYLYDANGNRIALTGPDGKTTRYAYDALNRLVALTTEGGTSQTQYDRSSLPLAVVQPNGVTASTAYDAAKRPVSVSHAKAGNVLLAYAYGYDPDGNKTSQTETRPGQPARTSSYAYDALDRLVRAAEPEGATDTAYDSVGNRISEAGPGGTTTYTYNNRNQLIQIAGARTATLAYDANGNLARKTVGASQTEYTWNIRDQLIAVTKDGAEVGTYLYDAAGLRIEKRLPTGTTRSLWDGRQPFVDTDGSGNVTARFESDGRHPVQALTAEGRRYFGLDALGSATLLTDIGGGQAAFTRYDPWGRTEAQEGTATKLGYTGHEMDGETGLIYFKARHYDPELGRFISEDPYEGKWGTPMSLHRYLYAYANPMVYVDLEGYESNRELMGIDDKGMDEAIRQDPSAWGAAKYAGKVTLYETWNFVTGGFLKRQDDRREKYDRREITESEFDRGTVSDAGVSIGATLVGGTLAGKASGAVASRVGGTAAGRVAASSAAGATYGGTTNAIEQAEQMVENKVISSKLGKEEFDVGELGKSVVGGAVAGPVLERGAKLLERGAQAAGGLVKRLADKAQGMSKAAPEAPRVESQGIKSEIVGESSKLGTGADGTTTVKSRASELADPPPESLTTGERVRDVGQKAYDYAVENPRVEGLNRMQLGKDAEVQATRWLRRWAERNDVALGDGGLRFQVRGEKSIPDVVFEPEKQIFDFKLTPKAVRSAQSKNFAQDFPDYSIDYIFGPGPWR